MSLTSSESACVSVSGMHVVSALQGAAAGSINVVRDVRSLDQVNVAFGHVDARRTGRENSLPAAQTVHGGASRRLLDPFLQSPAVVAARSPTILA